MEILKLVEVFFAEHPLILVTLVAAALLTCNRHKPKI